MRAFRCRLCMRGCDATVACNVCLLLLMPPHPTLNPRSPNTLEYLKALELRNCPNAVLHHLPLLLISECTPVQAGALWHECAN